MKIKLSEAIKLIESKTGKKVTLKEAKEPSQEELQEEYLDIKEMLEDVQTAFTSYKKFNNRFAKSVSPDVEDGINELYKIFEKDIEKYKNELKVIQSKIK